MSDKLSNIATLSTKMSGTQNLRARRPEEQKDKKSRSHDSFFERAPTVDAAQRLQASASDTWYQKVTQPRNIQMSMHLIHCRSFSLRCLPCHLFCRSPLSPAKTESDAQMNTTSTREKI
jgi:hypothetical protein